LDPASSTYVSITVGLIVVAVLIYVFASVAESAISSLNRARVQRLAEQKPAGARAINDFVEHPTTYLTATSILKLAALVGVVIGSIRLVEATAGTMSVGLLWLSLSLLALLLGWIVPQAVSATSPEGVAQALATPVRVLTWFVSPIAATVTGTTRALSRLLGATASPEGQVITPDELKEIVAASEGEGLIERRERRMIDNILDLENVSVREVMVPRPDIDALPETTNVRDAVGRFVAEGYSRLPVYRETIDDVVGVLYGKDLFPLLLDGRSDALVGGFVRPAYFVPESKKCDDLLRELQQQRVQIAIVVDEYGGTAGLVTIEDLIEEIVGEIQDEYDTEEQKIVPEGSDEALVDGLVSIDDVNDALALSLTAKEVDTIGGLVYEQLGRVPIVGDQIEVDHAQLTVVASHGRRVTRVRVKRLPEEESNGSSPPKASLGER
jgi:CBS domain containing-hemolysin-like protein